MIGHIGAAIIYQPTLLCKHVVPLTFGIYPVTMLYNDNDSKVSS